MDKAPSCEGAFFIGNIILALLITLVKIEVGWKFVAKEEVISIFSEKR